MSAVFVQTGDAIDYTPTTDVAAGDVVVLSDLIGIAKLDIKANELGALAVVGVFEVEKPSDETIAQGDTLFWDDTANEATLDSAAGVNALMGKAAKAAALADATVQVRLTP